MGALDIIVADCRTALDTLPPASFQCCVTSPPYYNLRDYGHDDQIGQEASPAAYLEQLVDVFAKVRRVLRDDGTLWLNLGDSYGKGKQLLGIPWRVAFALQDNGWVLRSEIIWAKAAHKPERVRDRPTTSHERFFLFSKGPRYFYDAAAVAIPSASSKGRPQRRRAQEIADAANLTPEHFAAIRSVGITDVGKGRSTQSGTGRNTAAVQALADEAKAVLKGYYREFLIGDTVNLRSVWNVDTTVYPGAHTAVFPPALIEPCIKAGSRVGDRVLDPFAGVGTTGLVSSRLERACTLIEINEKFADLTRQRLGLFAKEAA